MLIRVRNTENASSSAAFATYTWGWIFAGYGLTLAICGDRQFPRAYFALHEVPHPSIVLGAVFAVSAAGMLAAQRSRRTTVRNAGLMVLVVLCLAMVGVVAYAALMLPDIGWAGCWLWLGMATQMYVLRRLRARRILDDASNR